jgi:hypothetical protein
MVLNISVYVSFYRNWILGFHKHPLGFSDFVCLITTRPCWIYGNLYLSSPFLNRGRIC